MSIGDRPEYGLESVEAGREQGGATHNHDEDAGGMRPAHKSVENLDRRLVHESQAQYMDDDGQNDQR